MLAKPFLDAMNQDQVLATMPSGLFLVDDRRRIVFWNREAERITGYSASEVIGRHCSFLEGIECGNICGLFDDGSPDKPIIGAECRIRSKCGEMISISKNVDFLKKDGEIIGGVESFNDISRQKDQEQRLRSHSETLEKTVQQRTAALEEERTRLRMVLDGMPDPAYIVTDDYQLDFINRALEKIYQPIENQRCFEVFHDLQQPCNNCPWHGIKRGLTIKEERRLGPDSRVYEIVHSPLNTPLGDVQKLAVCRDITEHKEAIDKLAELNKQLDAFAQTVSHDLRAPLTGVLCYTELIMDEYRDELKEQGLELLQEVANQGQRMKNLVEDLLCFSMASRALDIECPSETNKVVDLVLRDNTFELNSKRINVTTTELPGMMIPESLLYDLISNLLLNAVRYGCQQDGQIEITGAAEKAFNTINVADHGPGIPDAEKEHIFNVFVRGSNAADTQGTGIGLATVKRIVQSYGGSVGLQETPGGGCTFSIQIPNN